MKLGKLERIKGRTETGQRISNENEPHIHTHTHIHR